MTSSRFYLLQLDGLRFLAFLSVFLAHGMWGTERVWLARIQPVGNFGVDLFFVLSSYLLTTFLLREQPATGRIYLGRISYGLYVLHGLMYAVTHTRALRWPSRLEVAFTLTLAPAALSYQVLERPFLRLKGRFTYVRSAPV